MIKTDFHVHLLPDLDCSGLTENAIRILISARNAGVETIVLTPHFYHDYEKASEFIKRRDDNFAALQDAVSRVPELSALKFHLGAEVLCCRGISHLPGIESLCIRDTATILVEMPNLTWKNDLVESLEDLRDMGLTVIIAHADRYDRECSEGLFDAGFAAQINAEALLIPKKRKYVLEWIERGHICAIGSDIHNSKTLDFDNAYALFTKADRYLGEFRERKNV